MKERRFRHKLNMPEPRVRMVRWIAVFLVLAGILYLLRLRTAACCAAGLAGVLFVLLVILLAVESHQDKVMVEMQREEEE